MESFILPVIKIVSGIIYENYVIADRTSEYVNEMESCIPPVIKIVSGIIYKDYVIAYRTEQVNMSMNY